MSFIQADFGSGPESGDGAVSGELTQPLFIVRLHCVAPVDNHDRLFSGLGFEIESLCAVCFDTTLHVCEMSRARITHILCLVKS